MEQSIRKAVIPAAGLGIRFLPATKSQPKEMLPIVDKPIIHFVVEELVKSGIDDIVIITGRGKRAIEDYFDFSPELEGHLKNSEKLDLIKSVEEILNKASIHYIRQREPKGLGDAVLCAEKHIGNEPFVVALGDDIIISQEPFTKQLISIFNKERSPIIGVEEVPSESIPFYGIVDGDKISDNLFKIKDLIEKPQIHEAPSNMGIIGRYILTPEIFECLKQTAPDHTNEIQLTDALKILLKKQSIYACKLDGRRYDVGNKAGYLKAIIEFALQREDLKNVVQKYLKELSS